MEQVTTTPSTPFSPEGCISVLNCVPSEVLHLLIRHITLGAESSSSPLDSVIPWQIKNKYYQALVHFVIRNELSEILEIDSPVLAVVVDANKKFDFSILTSLSEARDYEVALLIGIKRGETKEKDGEGSTGASSEEWEDFGGEAGFEYVEVDLDELELNPAEAVGRGDSTSDPDVEGCPAEQSGPSRISEAFQTYMWPTMKRVDNSHSTQVLRSTSDENAASFMGKEEALPTSEAIGPGDWKIDSPLGVAFPSASSFLDPDSSSATPSSQPASSHSKPTLGFDDDFSDFVSAPQSSSPTDALAESSSKPLPDPTFDLDAPSLPQDQIQQTHDLIFGPPSTSVSAFSDLEDIDGEMGAGLEDVMDAGIGHFDLESVFGRLKMLKDRAERIEDLEERRRFAEKVALGFAMHFEE